LKAKKIFYFEKRSSLLQMYSAGVVAVISKVVGLASSVVNLYNASVVTHDRRIKTAFQFQLFLSSEARS
jgi:hypothetical protein